MSISTLINPQNLAIIGASNNPAKLGYQLLANVKNGGFKGQIFPVNPHETKILDLKVSASVATLPVVVDLAIIIIPAPLVLEAVKECALKGIKNIIIISAGFGEANAQGKKIELEIKNLATEYQLNILGPNCLGLINPALNLNATFAKFNPDASVLRRQNVAFISQSGAIGSAVLDWAANKNIGFSLFASLGNKTVLDENDFFSYLLTDDSTELVVAYLEEIREGEKLMQLVSQLVKKKPVAILKAGRTVLGERAALSHTGSLAGSYEATLAGLRRSGAIILETISEAFNLMRLIKTPRQLKDYSLQVVSNAGGPLVLTIDQATLAKIEIRQAIDVLGDAKSDKYEQVLGKILADPKNNNVLILLTPQTSTEIEKTATVIGKFAQQYPAKLICTSFMGGGAVAAGKKILASYLVPNYDYPEEAIKALSLYLDYQKRLVDLKKYNHEPLLNIFKPQGDLIDYLATNQLLKKYGLPVVKTAEFNSKVKSWRFPVVAKIVGPKIIHKTDEQAIFLQIKNFTELQKIHRTHRLLRSENNYLVVQEKVSTGLEMIVGFKRDASWGPIIMVGAGGIYAETFKDVQLEVGDIDAPRALKMIKKLKIYPVLAGSRGQKARDIKFLVKVILAVAKIAQEQPTIQELDLNPVFLKTKGGVVVDGRVII